MLHIGSKIGMGGGFETEAFTDEIGDGFRLDFAHRF